MPGPVAKFDFRAAPGSWRLCRALPNPDLNGIVAEYWEVEGHMTAFCEKVLPNASVELMFNLGAAHRLLTDRGVESFQTAWVSGLQDQSLVIESLAGTHLVSVRLGPLGAWRVLQAHMGETARRVLDLEAVVGRGIASMRDALFSAGTPDRRFRLLERFVRERVARATAPHRLAQWLELSIAARHGAGRLDTLARESGFSRKHLNAVFKEQIGLSPKAYARVHRFLWVVSRLRRGDAVSWPYLAHAAGFADQAHLSREFQRIAGASPTTFRRMMTPDGSALVDAFEAG